MQGIALKALMFAINLLIDKGLLSALKEIVLIYTKNNLMTGAEKKAAVKVQISNFKGELQTALGETSENLLNLGIEIVVLWAKNKTGVSAK